MKILLLAFFSSLLAPELHAPLPPSSPGYCEENSHYQCRRIGLAMSCGCVPND